MLWKFTKAQSLTELRVNSKVPTPTTVQEDGQILLLAVVYRKQAFGLSSPACFHTKMTISYPSDITFQKMWGKLEFEAIMENAL